jgi:hypothetical protein
LRGIEWSRIFCRREFSVAIKRNLMRKTWTHFEPSQLRRYYMKYACKMLRRFAVYPFVCREFASKWRACRFLGIGSQAVLHIFQSYGR